MDAPARSLPVMSRQISTTEGSEPGLVRWEAARLDRLRGEFRWSADQRDLDDGATGWQSTSQRRQPRDTAPTRASGAPESLREEGEGKVAQPELATFRVHTSRGAIQLRSGPEGLAQQQEASVEAAASSGTGVTRRL